MKKKKKCSEDLTMETLRRIKVNEIAQKFLDLGIKNFYSTIFENGLNMKIKIKIVDGTISNISAEPLWGEW